MPNELMKTLTVGANTYDLPQKTSDLTNDSGFITNAVLLVTLTEDNNTYTADHTYAEIDAAINAGKTVVVDYDGYILSLLFFDDVSYTYYFGITELLTTQATINQRIALVNNTNAWEMIFPQYNMVTSVNGSTGNVTISVPTKTSDLTNDSGFLTNDTTWNGVQLAKQSSTNTGDGTYVPLATSISPVNMSFTPVKKTPTNNAIAKYDSSAYLYSTTPLAGDNSTKVATTAYVDNAVPTKTSDLTNDSGFITSESDPIFTASAAHGITSTDITNWNGKSDFSGNYNDLTNKPTIPAAVTESTVADWGFTKNTGTYSKPDGGIPKTDLASAVQTSLGKADTALQSYTESDPIFTASAAHGVTSTDITNWNNKISEPASEGTNGQVLMTNGSGTRTWGSVSTADEKIKLTSQSTSGDYPLIFGPTSITSNSTYQGYYNTGVTVNPNTKVVTATTFVGALTGTASGNLTSSSTLDASKLSGAIPSAVTATTQTSTDNSTKIATTAFVQTAIDNLPEPMIFKGSLGTGGTITSLPTASTSNTGYTYKVITTGTYASQSAKIGDTFISDGSTWILIPSGDEPSGTVTSITLEATSPISIDSNSAITTSGTRTLSHVDSGVTAGTYKSVTVDSKGHVTAGSNPSETDPVFSASAAADITSANISGWNAKATKTVLTATIAATDWTGSDPYTNSVTITGLLTTDTPIMDLVASSTYATAQAEIADYANIYKATCSAANTLTVYATSAPSVDLDIQLVCVR